MNTTINRQQWQEEEALRRFQLISPLLQTGLDDAKRIQLRKKIAEENNISVRSLYRYEKAFSERQFTGLKPADREKHRSQLNHYTKTSRKLFIPVGTGNPTSQGGSGAVGCPDHLHSGNGRACGTRYFKAFYFGTPYL